MCRTHRKPPSPCQGWRHWFGVAPVVQTRARPLPPVTTLPHGRGGSRACDESAARSDVFDPQTTRRGRSHETRRPETRDARRPRRNTDRHANGGHVTTRQARRWHHRVVQTRARPLPTPQGTERFEAPPGASRGGRFFGGVGATCSVAKRPRGVISRRSRIIRLFVGGPTARPGGVVAPGLHGGCSPVANPLQVPPAQACFFRGCQRALF